VIGLDPSPLEDLQESNLKNRYHLDASKGSDDEPKTLAESHWRIQPRWHKIVTIVFVPPFALFWGYLIRSGEFLENEGLALGLFGVFGAIVLMHFFFIARAYWRMEI
jgi:hypothetical protein